MYPESREARFSRRLVSREYRTRVWKAKGWEKFVNFWVEVRCLAVLRDDTKNGCVGDCAVGTVKSLSNISQSSAAFYPTLDQTL